MKHIETHTYVLSYCKNKIKFFELHKEIKLFKDAWPNANVDADLMGTVSISYTGSALRDVAEGAALEFQRVVSRHDWWEEV